MEQLAAELEASQPKSFAAGMDMILADVLDSARAVHGTIERHGHAIVFLVEYPRDPGADEPGCDWIRGTQAQRAATLAAQTAVLISTYLRMLGFEARAHTATCSDLDLGRLFPSHVLFRDPSRPHTVERVRRVLTAFALRCPQVGCSLTPAQSSDPRTMW